MSSELLINSIVVDSVEISTDYDVDIHINKRLENFSYGLRAPDDAVGLSYIGYEPPTTTNTLNIAILSEHVRENSFFFNHGTTNIEIINGFSYSSSSNKIEGTDIFLPMTSRLGADRPAWYGHSLPANTVSATIASISSGGATQSVNSSSYVISLDSGILATEFRNYYNSVTKEYILYYIDSRDSSGKMERHLLQSNPILHEATMDDLTDTGEVAENSGGYIVTQIGDRYDYEFANGRRKALREKQSSRLSPAVKDGLSLEHNWFPYITNGSVRQTYEEYIYNYVVNEFDDQDFIPTVPYLFSVRESVDVIAPNVVQVPQKRIAHSMVEGDTEEKLYIDLVIKDHRGINKHFVSSDPLALNRTDEDWKLCAFDVDRNLGIVYCPLAPAILPGDEVLMSYYYPSETLELTWLDLNPQRQPGIENYMHVIYAVPNVAYGYNSIYYLKVDRNNFIVEATQGLGFHDGAHPVEFIDMRKADDDGNCNSSTVVGMKYRNYGGPLSGEEFWTDNYSVEGTNKYQYLILAEITFTLPAAPLGASILDARVLGGGPRMNELQAIVESNPVIQYSSPDLINEDQGITFPGHFANFIRYPYTLLRKYGGAYDEDFVLEQIKAHAPANAYFILEPYGIIPRICEIYAGPDSGNISISWAVESPEYGYNIYVSESWDGPWYGGSDVDTLYNSYPIILDAYKPGGCSSPYIINVKSNSVVKIAMTVVNLSTNQESPHSIIYEVRAAS